ncbi:MAG: class III signal peptide-containing protein [Methanobrevibacter sp.]|nr:class III signal peptide-containing protein [Methanobrevibacter sp.]
MMRENRGQVSLEYILIFSISLILLIAFTLPMAEKSVESTLDVSDAIEVKSNLAEISRAIMQVYGEGQGSRHTIHVTSQKSIRVNVDEDSLSSDLRLKDGTYKRIKINHASKLKESFIQLSRGENTVVVEWPTGSESMVIYTKLF